MKFLSDREPWQDISACLEKSKGKVYCAIGYIGLDAWKYLPLKSGDILVCDASEASVKNGATNPNGLTPFLNRGVLVFSRSGLHAKVIANSRTAWIGSANASSNSANQLVEASVRLDSKLAVKATKAFVLEQRALSRELAKSDVRDLIPLMPKRIGSGPLAIRPAFELPKALKSLHILDTGPWTPSPAQERHIDENLLKVRRAKRGLGKGSSLSMIYGFNDWDARPGEWVSRVMSIPGFPKTEKIVFPPAQIVDITGVPSKRIHWLADPLNAEPFRDQIDLERYFDFNFTKTDTRKILGKYASQFVDQFRL